MRGRPRTKDVAEEANKQVIFREISRPKIKALTVAEELANDQFYNRNYFMSELKMNFPNEPKMWSVDQMYPFAENGPLFIDHVSKIEDEIPFQTKAKLMKGLGFRYVYLKEGMTTLEASEQLA